MLRGMKITVGHLMIVAGVGTYVVLGPLGGFRKMDEAKAPQAPVVETQVLPPALPFEEKLPAGETLPTEAVEAPPVVAPPEPEVPKKAVVEDEKPAVPKPARRKRARPAAPAEPAARKPSGKNLIGVYVSLKLANGREVKGALVEQTPTLYKIELPGLGAMSYPARDVVSITPAQ